MYNNYQEINFLLNLLLKNDKRGEMKTSHIFNEKGDFIIKVNTECEREL
jgi:hypothetical protein